MEKTDKLKEVYEEFKHFDYVLSDKAWVTGMAEEGDLRLQILYDLWQAVKEAANPAE